MTVEQEQKIKQMRQMGQSYSQIASDLLISINTVKSYCRRNNIGAYKIEKKEPMKEINTICKQCKKPLEQGSKGQPKKFCSEECRRAWWKANDNQIVKSAYYKLTCAECGKRFESYGNKNRKFCTHACYIKNRFEKARACHDQRAI